MQMSRQQPE